MKRLVALILAVGLGLFALVGLQPANAGKYKAQPVAPAAAAASVKVITIVNSPNSANLVQISSDLHQTDGKKVTPGNSAESADQWGQTRVWIKQVNVGSYRIGQDGKGYGPCHSTQGSGLGVFSNPPNDPPNARAIYKTWFGYTCGE